MMRLMLTSVLLSWTPLTSISKLVCSCYKVAKRSLACRIRTMLRYLKTFTRKHTNLRPSTAPQDLNGADLNLLNLHMLSLHLALTMVAAWQRSSNIRSLHHSIFSRYMRLRTTTVMPVVIKGHPSCLLLLEHPAHDRSRSDITTNHLVQTRLLVGACHHRLRRPTRCHTPINKGLEVFCRHHRRRNISTCSRRLPSLRLLVLHSGSVTPTTLLLADMDHHYQWVIQDLRILTLGHEHRLLKSSRSWRTVRHRRLRTTSNSRVKATCTMPTQALLPIFQWVLLLHLRLPRRLHAIVTIEPQFLPSDIASGKMTICESRDIPRTRSDSGSTTMYRGHLRESPVRRSLVHRLVALLIVT